MKKNEVAQKGFFGWKINKNLTKVSNLILVVVLVIYVALFIVIISFIKAKEIDSVITPDYEHEFYNEEIVDYFSIIPQRTYSSEGVETLNYRVIFYNQGRYIGGADPGYRISSFTAKAGITDDISDETVDSMYYFTEQTDSQTSASHNLTINSNSGVVNPTTMYCRIKYRSNVEDRVATFTEDIQLMPTKTDIERFNIVYDNKVKLINEQYDALNPDDETAIALKKSAYALNISDVNGNKVGIAQLIANRDATATSPKYNVTYRVEMNDKNSKYHIDTQTWIINKKGEYLPYFGLYGFSSDHDKYNSGSYNLYDETNCEYLCIKLTVYFEDGTSTVCYYKQNVSRLETSTYNYSVSLDAITCYYEHK